jgi:dsDNA-specific endonuclease/ATPase MutS2
MVPSPLQHSSARVLEFDRFRDVLAVYVSSPLGKARIAKLEPSFDRAWSGSLLAQRTKVIALFQCFVIFLG